jgi:hypothetical protein
MQGATDGRSRPLYKYRVLIELIMINALEGWVCVDTVPSFAERSIREECPTRGGRRQTKGSGVSSCIHY